jgi:2-alkenal reductase
MYQDDVHATEQEAPPPSPDQHGVRLTIWGAIFLVAFGMLLGLALAWGSFGATQPTALFDEGQVTSVFERASPAIVEIGVSQLFSQQSGSGFFVDAEGHIVTNAHIVSMAGDVRVTLHDGRTLDATLLGSSRADDLAILQVDPDLASDIEPLRLADSDRVIPGQLAIAIGSPYENTNSVTVGVVSGRGRSQVGSLNRPVPELIQTDAALNPGNSGGPLLNSSGEAIGVVSAVQIDPSRFGTGASLQTGVGFAVSSNTVRQLLPSLLQPEEYKRPWIGILSGPLTPSQTRVLGMPVEKGVYVSGVCRDSPAERAGLQYDDFRTVPSGRGDFITAVDGESISSVADIVEHLNTLRPGDRVDLTIIREGQEQSVGVTLDEWKSCARTP